mgnify:CR=1 FL=1
MKRVFGVLLVFVWLTGCENTSSELSRAMSLRERLLASEGCTFDTVITADYGDKVYAFSMSCQADSQGNLTFTVTDPQTITGISGTVTQQGGHLTFDGQALAFKLLADGQVTPVSAPWLLIRTLRSGYLSACGVDGDDLRIAIDDSYEDKALHLDIWINSQDIPIRGEILWQGQRVVSLEVRNFSYV